MAFTPINTQEEFDAAIGDRLERDRKKYAEQFETDMKEKGWKSPDEVEQLTADLNTQITTLQTAAAETAKALEEKDAEIAKGATYRAELDKTRIALANGLDIKYADRLRGNNKEEWEADAKELAKDFAAFAASQNHPAPLGAPGSSGNKSTRDQFADAVNNLFG